MTSSVRLLQFTDSHVTGTPDGIYQGVDTLAALRHAIAHGRQRFIHHDAVLLTGDLVDEDVAGYRWIRQLFGQSAVPVLALPGNHDDVPAMEQSLNAAPFQVCGSAEFGPWLVVMLNSVVPREAWGRLGADQLNALSATLSAAQDRHVLICMHHHPIEMRSGWLDTVGLQDAEEFHRVIDRHTNVRGVLWGHVHQALDVYRNGVRFMSTPSTCAQFLPRSDDFAIDARPPGYRTLELLPDGTIASEVVWLEVQTAVSAA